MAEEKKKKKVNYSGAWAEAKKLIWNARWRLFAGGVLMLISRLAGMVLPASMKFIADNIFLQHQYQYIKWIAVATLRRRNVAKVERKNGSYRQRTA